MIGSLGRLEAAATLGQHCPQMTQRRCRPYIYEILPLFAVTIFSVPSFSVPSGGERVSTKVSISDAAIDLGWI